MSDSTSKVNVSDETLFEESYKRLLPELEALSAEDFVDVNLDIPTAVSTVLGVLPQLSGLRADIVKELPLFDLPRYDRLEDYTMALSFANAQHATATRNPDGLTALSEDGTKQRATFQNDISALIGRGLINPAAIKSYTGLTGPKNIAADLQIQAHVLKDNWARIAGKCGTTSEELEHALKLAAHLLRLAGLKEQSPAVQAEAAEMRVRAFTLFTRAYDDARRAVIYLRWHEDDADTIAPSLYAGRGGSRKKVVAEEAATTPATSVPVTTTTPNTNQEQAAGGTGKVASTGTNTANPFLV